MPFSIRLPMRVLLDECLPRKFAVLLSGHTVRSARTEGLSGIKNGELLKRAESGGFEAFITVDRNLPYQHNFRHRSLGVIVLAARSNKLADLAPLAEYVLEALPRLKPGEIIVVGA